MSELVLLPTHPKVGESLLVETAVQDILDASPTINDRLEQLQTEIDTVIRGHGESADYARAKRMKQAVFAATAFEVGKVALPRLQQQLVNESSLTAPDDFILHTYIKERATAGHTAPHLAALRAGCYLLMQCSEAMDNGTHPASALYSHLDTAHTDQQLTLKAWRAGSGKNRWPFYSDAQKVNGPTTLMGAICINIDLGINLLSAKAVHHLIHENPTADEHELDRVIADATPRIGWISSTNRHLAWRPDWAEAQERGEHIGIMPTDGAEALLQQPTTQILEPNDFAASIHGMAAMQNADFCPHSSIAAGPPANAASCAGDPQARYPEESDRQAARAFFAEMGFIPQDDTFNFSSVALVIARSVVRSYVLPEYRRNYVAEH